MARIRSIKPEFWKDGKVRRLSQPCALFFIGLWNFCDDEGKCLNDSFELSSNMPLFKSQHISKWIQTLFEVGLIQLSTDFRWISVANWNHQKIDKPRLPKVRKSEIEWLPLVTPDLSTNAHRMLVDKSSNVRRKDRIGKDRIGKDRISSTPPEADVAVTDDLLDSATDSKSRNLPEISQPTTQRTWIAYCLSFRARYHTDPIRNAKVNSQLKQFVARVGQDAAPLVASFYVQHSDQFYVRKMHPVGLLLADAEKLHAEWKTGHQMTSTQARQVENTADFQDRLKRISEGTL